MNTHFVLVKIETLTEYTLYYKNEKFLALRYMTQYKTYQIL